MPERQGKDQRGTQILCGNRGPNGKVSHMGNGVLTTGRAGKLEPGAISRCLKLISSVVHIWSVIMITRNSGVV